MAIVFDMYGNLIPQKVKYKTKHSDLTNDVIKESIIDDSINKYWCKDCERFHKRKIKGRNSQIFIKHQNSAIKVSESYIWSVKMAKSFDKYDIRIHVKTLGSRKQ